MAAFLQFSQTHIEFKILKAECVCVCTRVCTCVHMHMYVCLRRK